MKLLGLLNAVPKKKPSPEPEPASAAAEIHRSLVKAVEADLGRVANVEGDYARKTVVVTVGGRSVEGFLGEDGIVTNFPDPALDAKTEGRGLPTKYPTLGADLGSVDDPVRERMKALLDDELQALERPVDYAERLRAAADLPGAFGAVLPPDAQENLPAMKADDQTLENLALGKASTKALMRVGFETIGDMRTRAPSDWASLPGIGAVGARKIKEALAAYADAPEADDTPEAEAPASPSVAVSFEGLILASDDLTISGLETYKTIPGRLLFEGVGDDDGTVIAGLRLLSDYPKILVLLEDGASYIPAAHRFAERYRVPCLTSIPF